MAVVGDAAGGLRWASAEAGWVRLQPQAPESRPLSWLSRAAACRHLLRLPAARGSRPVTALSVWSPSARGLCATRAIQVQKAGVFCCMR